MNNVNSSLRLICYGEVLWDVFPDYKRIGGAPLNVAVKVAALGHDVSIISRVGNDQNGEDIVDFLNTHEVTTTSIQIDPVRPTGVVQVNLDDQGTASYAINFPSAWDFIESNENDIPLVRDANAFIYGSLASRNEASRTTLLELLEVSEFKVLDINLRPPHYSLARLRPLMDMADFIKFNDEEIEEISKALNCFDASIETTIIQLAQVTNTPQICVTKGDEGAMLYANNAFFQHKGYKVNVVDTVGAGDSFLARLICDLLNKVSPEDALDNACALGALIASKKGANPKFTEAELQALKRGKTS